MCKEVIIIKCQLIRLAFSLSYNLYCMQRERSFCDRQLTDHSSFCDGILNKEMNLKYRKNRETDFKGKKSVEHPHHKLSINRENEFYYKKHVEDTPLLSPNIFHRVTTLFFYEELPSLSRNATGAYVLKAMHIGLPFPVS